MKSRLTLSCLLLFFFFNTIVFSQIIHVTPSGSGLKDGSSWANALAGNDPAASGYTRLADTLRHALSGAEFWVAEGTYLPCWDNDRNKAFEIVQNISVYGGFSGIESQLNEREIINHQTRLSGDIGTQENKLDNTLCIIRTTVNSPWTNTTTLNGLIIENAQNDLGTGYGGGIFSTGRLDIQQCVFQNNFAVAGGGICTRSTVYGNQPKPFLNISHCIFRYNQANIGAGINSRTKGVFSHSKFYNNKSTSQGGAVQISSSDTVTILNCLIVNNSGSYGGGVDINGGPVKIISSTITNNSGTATNCNVQMWFNSKCTIYNSILYEPCGFQALSGSVVNVSYSCIKETVAGSGNITEDPLFIFPTSGYGWLFDASTADFGINFCSTLINAGNDSLCPEELDTDILDNPRILYDEIDIGAIEFDSLNTPFQSFSRIHDTLYVVQDTLYAGNGKSWNEPISGYAKSCKYPGYTLLYEVLKDAESGTQVWLEKGVYKPSLENNRNHFFELGEGVCLIGGFGNNESSLIERDTLNNLSYLSVEYGNDSLRSDNGYHVISTVIGYNNWLDTAMLNTIRITAGYANGLAPKNHGGGVLIEPGTKLAMKFCTIQGNYSSGEGGGIYNAGELTVHDGTIMMNTGLSGGGIFNTGKLSGLNTTIDSNSCLVNNRGNGIYSNGNLTLNGGSVSRSGSLNAMYGGGIALGPSSICTLSGIRISQNSTRQNSSGYGGGIYNEGLLTLDNCKIDSNFSANYGGGIYNETTGILAINTSRISFNSTAYFYGFSGGSAVYNANICTFESALISNNSSEMSSIHNPTSVRNSIIVNNETGIVTIENNIPILFSTIVNNDHFGVSGSPVRFQYSVLWNDNGTLPDNSIALYSCIKNGWPGPNLFFDPQFISPSAGSGLNFNGLAADWTPADCSSLIDKVNDTNLLMCPWDYLQNPRLIGIAHDIGAIEKQEVIPGLLDYSMNKLYFSDSTVSIGRGTSWTESAGGQVPSCRYPGFSLLAEALIDAPPETEIWLKNGKYQCCVDHDRKKFFLVGPGIKIVGGFNGLETTINERVISNLSLFTGDIGIEEDSTDNQYNLLHLNDLFSESDTNEFIGIKFMNSLSNGSGIFSQGGCIRVEPGRNLVLRNCELANNYGPGSLLHCEGKTSIINTRIHDNSSATAITNSVSASIKVINSEFYHQRCLFLNSGSIEIDNSIIRNNINGPPVSNSGNLILTNTLFHHNSGNQIASVLANSNQAIVKKCDFIENVSKAGALVNTGNLYLEGCDFILNKSDSVVHVNGQITISYGPAPAAVCNATGDCRITRCNFSKNSSFGHGGAVYNSGEIYIDSSSFDENTSGVVKVYSAGGMFNIVFTSNRFTGGAISNFGICKTDNCQFLRGFATLGGAIYNNVGSEMDINRCTLSNNFSQRHGGALMNEGYMTMNNSILINNESGTPSLENSIICMGNGGTTKFINSVFSNNKANYNFGLIETGYTRGSMGTVVNIPDTVTINNSILWNNIGSINNNNSSQIKISYSLIDSTWIATGNFFDDPLFVAPSNKIGRDSSGITVNYRLHPCSPCINAGNNSLVADSLDLDGNPRIVESVDMGAYEYPVVETGHRIFGSIYYDNEDTTAVDSVWVILRNETTAIDSFQTRAPGEYCFSNVQPGQYQIECRSVRTSGGSSSVDAFLILKHFTQFNFLTGLRLLAASTDAYPWINAIDGLLVHRKFTGAISHYNAPEWIFETKTVIMTNENLNVPIRAICRGDVDASFEP